ncbi:hypothetical protein JOE63_002599 [Cellulosimicrobium cellulans]|uniref:hypothetical protein n=1 Tax=Cellulosimicrobium cellulans TaxID=1710 RepID=UPI001956A71E|nr:hypothetical protein [Cellulosimicrobium cellulans]MBM7820122.1 hypothetical protein [Cellulosimicrobium cellulans]
MTPGCRWRTRGRELVGSARLRPSGGRVVVLVLGLGLAVTSVVVLRGATAVAAADGWTARQDPCLSSRGCAPVVLEAVVGVVLALGALALLLGSVGLVLRQPVLVLTEAGVRGRQSRSDHARTVPWEALAGVAPLGRRRLVLQVLEDPPAEVAVRSARSASDAAVLRGFLGDPHARAAIGTPVAERSATVWAAGGSSPRNPDET